MLVLQYVGKAPYKPGRLKSGLQNELAQQRSITGTTGTSGTFRVPKTSRLTTSNVPVSVANSEARTVSRRSRQSAFVDGQ